MRTTALSGMLVAALTGCAHAATTPAPAQAPASAPVASCTAPEHRQFDFWIGDWDLVLKTRKALDSDEWQVSHGVQHIESILNGCAIAERFSADGPGVPWAGMSHSVWQPALGKWRQTWVDDQGGYLPFTGGLENGVMALYGEPYERSGRKFQMRMVFLDVKPASLRWEWQRTADARATWVPMLIIEYRRRS